MKSVREFIVRPIRKKEIPELPRLWKSSGLMYRSRGRDSLKSLAGQRDCNPDLFLGAFDGDTLLGVSIATDDGRRGWINRLAVLPSARRRGVATALVKASEQALRNRGRRMFCTHIVRSNKESLRLFRKMGYKVETEIKYLARRESESY